MSKIDRLLSFLANWTSLATMRRTPFWDTLICWKRYITEHLAAFAAIQQGR